MNSRYQDDRGHRRDVTCVEVGAIGGTALGVLVALAIGAPLGLVAVAAGAIAGAALGKGATKYVYLEEWDSSVVTPFVGLQAPDAPS
jgi:uncharacterized membrane protein